jgi:hypothetical protein
VFLKVKNKRISLILGSFPNMIVQYCLKFEVLEKIGLVAYMISLLTSMIIHNVFQVSLLKKHIHYLNHVIDWTVIPMEHEREF